MPCRRRLFVPVIPLVVLSAFAGLSACSGGGSGGVDGEADTTPPVAVIDLVALDVTTTTARLEWTAPLDLRDDGSSGMVDGYDLRMATARLTEANFAQALPVPGAPEPLPAGQRHRLALTGLTPGASYWFALKSRDRDGNWSALSDCPQADCLNVQVVAFPDAALAQAMRDHCHKPTGDLLSSDVDTLRRLDAPSLGIVDLTGLECCALLEAAVLTNNDIVDLTPVHMLHNLFGLYVAGNRISSVAPLVTLGGLRQLHLAENSVTDLLPLSYLFSLQQLTLSQQAITDFTPLYILADLRDLYVGAMDLDNIDFAAHLTHLRNVSFEINHIYSIEPLRPLTQLETLNLMQNDVVDLAPLAGLAQLRDLNLGRNHITDLQALVDNAGLGAGDVVQVWENPLSVQALNVQIPALEARGVTVQR
jgi:hypothetical protein